MSVPKLPLRIDPPTIPISMRKGSPQQEPPKSNFFFILMMTFLIVWSFQAFRGNEKDSPIAVERQNPISPKSTPKLSSSVCNKLPQDFVDSARQAEFVVKPNFITLGSLDPTSPYRMLVTLSNRGAALTRVELNDSAYVDNSDTTGYLGQIIVDETLANEESRANLPGVAVQVVGKGTPAEIAGLKVGDRIVSFIDAKGVETNVRNFLDLREAMLRTKPGDKVKLGVYSAECLKDNARYQATILATTKYYTNYTSRSLERLGEVDVDPLESRSSITGITEEKNTSGKTDEVMHDSVKDDLLKSDEKIEKTGDGDVLVNVVNEGNEETKDCALEEGVVCAEKKFIEVRLVNAPLSVLRPSGMVRDYSDYLDLVGLQGGYVDFGENEENYLRNYDKKAPHFRKVNSEPASFLMTLGNIDGDKIMDWAPVESGGKRASAISSVRSPLLDFELAGVELRNGYWGYDSEASSENVAVFKKVLLERRLEVTKKYELVQEGEMTGKTGDSNASFVGNGRAYHLKLSFQIRNYDPTCERVISCLLDGPTGLPLEGAWFSSGRKTGPKMGSYGLRDVVVSINNGKLFSVLSCSNISQGKKISSSDEINLDFIGVDGQYFQCTAIPADGLREEKFTYAPIRVGTRVPEHLNFTDVSFRVKTADHRLGPYGKDGDTYSQEFTVFVGPKQRDIMSDYGLSKTIVYGWFWFVSIPLLAILHFFHDHLVFNYGVAIMMLTVLVRLCLFPLSRKQVLSSMRMQQLQPEIASLKEKYKDNPQEMMVAQSALFKKYRINPLSGCLPVLIQMPIFIGLYRALSIDVNLYGAPLFSKGIRWCSNLAAPDMAFDWSDFWNRIGMTGFNMGDGGFLSMFCLGPYLNILPVVTIALFLIQQKILMPPVVGNDEQARQQRSMRKMMNFMMIFMGFMFFKVPSGLCVYFIVSSLWGLLERKLLPKKSIELNIENEVAVQPVQSSGFSSKKEKQRNLASSGRSYEVYELKRDKKGRRIYSNRSASSKSSFRAWWDELVERAKEQQRLAKAEEEDRSRFTREKRRGR